MKKSEFIVNYLLSHQNDRGIMAQLRCLLNNNLRSRGWQAVAPLNGIGDKPVETIAGLFALHPLHKDANDYQFGTACRLLANKRKKGAADDGAVESPFDVRFRRMLNCDQNQLCEMLPQVIHGMKSESIAVNYVALMEDLFYWGSKVREKWARQYWSMRKEDEDVSD